MIFVPARVKIFILGILAFATAIIWYAVFVEGRGELTVAFLNVGQGDAIFIEAPNGNQALIDGGPGSGVLRELGKVMPFYDRSIDVVIATHPDKDHIGGLPDVLKRFDVGYVLEPGVESDTSAYKTFVQLTGQEHAQHILARLGMHVVLAPDVYLEILFPDRDVSGIDTNAASIVAQLKYGDIEFLLTGDAPDAIEKYITARDFTVLQSEVLKVAHHGSKTSSSPTFLAAVAPRYAVISAGADNSYGHPHQEVLDQLTAIGAEIIGTYDEGTIIFTTNGSFLNKK